MAQAEAKAKRDKALLEKAAREKAETDAKAAAAAVEAQMKNEKDPEKLK